LKLPMFTKALETKVIEERVFVDLEHLVQLLFDISNETSIAATKNRDPALGAMTLGVTTIGQALDGALTAHKEANGLTEQPKPCGVSRPHPSHLRMLDRKRVRCPGVDQPD